MAGLIRESGLYTAKYNGMFNPDASVEDAKNGLWGFNSRYWVHIVGPYWICMCRGEIDDYAVPSVKVTRNSDGNVIMICAKPFDCHYMFLLHDLSQRYPGEDIFKDLVHIFVFMGNKYRLIPAEPVIAEIRILTSRYNLSQNDTDMALMAFMHMYYGMVAEENKAGTMLGSLIKLVAAGDILIHNADVETAAGRLRGMSWRDIRDEAYAKYCLVRPQTSYGNSPYYNELLARGLVRY